MPRDIEHKVTDAGLALISKCISMGKAVNFTHAQLGTGIAPDTVDIATYTKLIAPFDNAALGERGFSGSHVSIPVQYLNTNVQQVINIGEIGIFATNPETKASVMVSYTTFGAYPDKLLPAGQTPMLKIYDEVINLATGAVVEVTIVPSAMLAAVEAVLTAKPGKLLRLDENGKLPASITGDAQTIQGNAPSAFAPASHTHSQYIQLTEAVTTAVANKLLRLNANGKLPADITGDAATLGGTAPDGYAKAVHAHTNATASAAGYMSATDKANLDTLVSRVNQGLKTTDSPTFAALTVNGIIKGAAYEA